MARLSEGVTKRAAPDDEIAVAVAVRRGAKVGRVRRHREVVKMLGVNEIGVGMMAAEIGQAARR